MESKIQTPPVPAPAVPAQPPSAPPKAYFIKYLIGIPIAVNGRAVGFEALGEQRGRLAVTITDDHDSKELLKGLRELAQKRAGGVVEVSEKEYNDAKKNYPYIPPAREASPVQPLRSHGDLFPKIKKGAAAAAAAVRRAAVPGPIPGFPPADHSIANPVTAPAKPVDTGAKPWRPDTANPPAVENPPAGAFKPKTARATPTAVAAK